MGEDENKKEWAAWNSCLVSEQLISGRSKFIFSYRWVATFSLRTSSLALQLRRCKSTVTSLLSRLASSRWRCCTKTEKACAQSSCSPVSFARDTWSRNRSPVLDACFVWWVCCTIVQVDTENEKTLSDVLRTCQLADVGEQTGFRIPTSVEISILGGRVSVLLRCP